MGQSEIRNDMANWFRKRNRPLFIGCAAGLGAVSPDIPYLWAIISTGTRQAWDGFLHQPPFICLVIGILIASLVGLCTRLVLSQMEFYIVN